MPPRRPITFLVALASSAAAFLGALGLAGCEAERAARGDGPPRRREEGPRWVAFSGGDPVERGWVKVDGLLWVEAEHADAFRRGYLWDGAAYATIAEADRAAASAQNVTSSGPTTCG